MDLAFATHVHTAREAVVGKPKPSHIVITTIAWCSKLKNPPANLVSLIKGYAPVTIERLDGPEYVWVWSDNPNSFHNQETLICHYNKSTYNAKIFNNGSVQVAGCSDPAECGNVARQLSRVLGVIAGTPPIEMDPPRMTNINSSFSLYSSINLLKLIRVCEATMGWLEPNFNPDRTSALNIKFSPLPGGKTVTATVYSTGCINIAGAQTLKEISSAYEVLLQQITPECYVKEWSEAEKRAKPLNVFMGYTYESLARKSQK
jgi:TATA-box binding protein (TBP) (component of TFIID and TFIIIB)